MHSGTRRTAIGVLVACSALASTGAGAEPPPYVDARHILRELHPDMAAFAKEARPGIARANAALLAAEHVGRGDACARQMLTELRWRINSTVDVPAARATLARLDAELDAIRAGRDGGANILPQDAQGSYGGCASEWFLKLDESGDALLSRAGWRGETPPLFLDRLDTPKTLIAYLERIIQSDPVREGVDRRKELNLATATLSRIVLRGGVAGRMATPDFMLAFRAFLDMWQDPQTGFFGEWYVDHGRVIKTADLSVTFHMARYTKGRIGHWPQLIDTLLAIRDRPYPQGWLDDDGMTNHNNYDVAELFRLGWPHMREDQKVAARREIARMLDWSLTHSIRADGDIVPTGAGEPLGDMYYFASAFLDSIGYFDKHKRFWTDEDFPNTEKLRLALLARAHAIAPDAPFAGSILARLAAPIPSEPGNFIAARVLPMSGLRNVGSVAAHEIVARRRTGPMPSEIEEHAP